MGLKDGPLTGAPINFPQAACCAPAAVFNEGDGVGIAILRSVGSVDAEAWGGCLDADDPPSISTRLIAGAPVDPVLVVDSVTVDEPSGNLTITYDVNASNAGGTWVVMATSSCGCCYVVGFNRVIIA
jgi:hypothetical protein